MTTDHEAAAGEETGFIGMIRAWWNRPSDLELELQATRASGAEIARANNRLEKENTDLAKDRDAQAQGWKRSLDQITDLNNELARVTVEKDHYFKESTERGKRLAELERIKGVVAKLATLVGAMSQELEKATVGEMKPNDDCEYEEEDDYDDLDMDDEDDFDMDDEDYCDDCGNLRYECEC